MTQKQKQALDFIRDELARTGGVAPSTEELARALGLASKSGSIRVLDELERQGRIVRDRRRARGIRLTDPDLSSTPDTALIAEVARRGLLRTDPCHA